MRLLAAAALVLLLAACTMLSACTTDLGGTRLGLQTNASVPAGGCRAAGLLPFRIERDGDEMVFVEPGTEEPVSIVWPFGFAAWEEEGVAVLYASDGSIVGREGETLDNIGGAPSEAGFRVCSVGVRTYT